MGPVNGALRGVYKGTISRLKLKLWARNLQLLRHSCLYAYGSFWGPSYDLHLKRLMLG